MSHFEPVVGLNTIVFQYADNMENTILQKGIGGIHLQKYEIGKTKKNQHYMCIYSFPRHHMRTKTLKNALPQLGPIDGPTLINAQIYVLVI